MGLEILSGFREDPNKADAYIDGRVLEPTSGRIYKGKAVVSGEGKRLRMRGYMGVSALGRTVVWLYRQCKPLNTGLNIKSYLVDLTIKNLVV